MSRYGDRAAIPVGKAPILKQRSGTDTVDTKCPNAHAAGLGHIAADNFGTAICPTCSSKLVPNVAVVDDR